MGWVVGEQWVVKTASGFALADRGGTSRGEVVIRFNGSEKCLFSTKTIIK